MDEIEFSAEGVSISYRNFSIKKVTFKLSNGDIMGLIGRSGAGKSTVIKALIHEKKPYEGKMNVTVNGKSRSIQSVIGYSPQSNSLFPYLSLKENIITFGRLRGMPKNDIIRQMNHYSKRMDLQLALDKHIVQLSGGMQKRADLIVTLIHNPKIIILDEPFTGLDVSLQKFIWDLLIELSKDGRIVIISSHMLRDVQRYCNKFGLVENGYFHGTEELMKGLTKTNQTLDVFLQKIFTRDLLHENGGNTE